jgi:hypothetical protein
LRNDDYVCSTYRDHVHALSKGVPPREIMSELFGKATGCCRGQGGSMHMFSAKHGVLGGYAFIGEVSFLLFWRLFARACLFRRALLLLSLAACFCYFFLAGSLSLSSLTDDSKQHNNHKTINTQKTKTK